MKRKSQKDKNYHKSANKDYPLKLLDLKTVLCFKTGMWQNKEIIRQLQNNITLSTSFTILIMKSFSILTGMQNYLN